MEEIKYCPQCELLLYLNEFTKTWERCKVCLKDPLPLAKEEVILDEELVDIQNVKIPERVFKAIEENKLLKRMHNNRLQQELSRKLEK